MPELALLSECEVRDPGETSSAPVPSGMENRPKWLESFVRRLAFLLELEADWDSYGAPPLKPDAVLAAFELMFLLADEGTPEPQVVPTGHGGVQLEWHQNGVDLEIEVSSPFNFNVLYENHQREESLEEELMSDLTPLVAWLKSVSG